MPFYRRMAVHVSESLSLRGVVEGGIACPGDLRLQDSIRGACGLNSWEAYERERKRGSVLEG